MVKSLSEVMQTFSSEDKAIIQRELEADVQELLTIKELRQQLGITQEQMADMLGIHQVNVSKLENRSNPNLSTLREYLFRLGFKLTLSAEPINGGKPIPIRGTEMA